MDRMACVQNGCVSQNFFIFTCQQFFFVLGLGFRVRVRVSVSTLCLYSMPVLYYSTVAHMLATA